MSEPLVDGIRVHSKRFCEPPCPFHAPSDHPLKDAPMHLRMDKGGLVERICEHGVGHDDPDSAAYMRKHGQGWAGVHGCDGCCTTKNSPKEELLARPKKDSSSVEQLAADNNMPDLRYIPGFENLYSITNGGRVYGHVSGRFLKSSITAKGYLTIGLRKDGRYFPSRISRLVLMTYDRLPEDKEIACHWDGDKTNNHISNLRWGTHQENADDQIRLDRQVRGTKHGRAKLNPGAIRSIKIALAHGERPADLARQYGVHDTLIHAIKKGYIWKTVV